MAKSKSGPFVCIFQAHLQNVSVIFCISIADLQRSRQGVGQFYFSVWKSGHVTLRLQKVSACPSPHSTLTPKQKHVKIRCKYSTRVHDCSSCRTALPVHNTAAPLNILQYQDIMVWYQSEYLSHSVLSSTSISLSAVLYSCCSTGNVQCQYSGTRTADVLMSRFSGASLNQTLYSILMI